MSRKPETEKSTTDDNRKYQRTRMQKEIIIQRLRERGSRITKQRLMLLDIILEEDCSCCKEIYYRAAKKDPNIGAATVYRMVNTLEEIGAISRKNMYRIACDEEAAENAYTIELDDNTVIELSSMKWKQIIKTGLTTLGYMGEQDVRSIVARPCQCME